jgi:hypothetical protein
MSPDELAWSMAHWLGLQSHVPGFRPVQDRMLVVVPVSGVDFDASYGPVLISRDRGLVDGLTKRLRPSAEVDSFVAAQCWAFAEIEAPTLLSAERAAVPLIDEAIARIRLEGQYSLATNPDGVALSFSRQGLLTDPIAHTTVLVTARDTKRTWMRSLGVHRVIAPASARRVEIPSVAMNKEWVYALRAWDRATRQADRLVAVGDLFEAVEFYAAGTKVPHILTHKEVRRVLRAIRAQGLGTAQQARLTETVAAANEPPLRIRFVEALRQDRVPYSVQEVDRLWNLRRHRNDALHGHDRGAPDSDDLQLGLALVNRMLVFRAWRSGGGTV